MFIGIAGIIGAGKSTLCQQLAEHLGFEAFREPVDDNPYLNDFYADMNVDVNVDDVVKPSDNQGLELVVLSLGSTERSSAQLKEFIFGTTNFGTTKSRS